MSTRKTKSESEITTSPAPRKRKTAAADPSAPKTTRSRKAAASQTSDATDDNSTGAVTHDAIATRAYFIAVERGVPGDPVADWLLAEQQLRRL
jgi:hypothetical protein